MVVGLVVLAFMVCSFLRYIGAVVVFGGPDRPSPVAACFGGVETLASGGKPCQIAQFPLKGELPNPNNVHLSP